MTLEDMKSLLAGRLGQRTDIDNMIYSELRQAQRVLEKTPPYPWFLLEATSREYGATDNPLPDDFIEFREDYVFIVKETTQTETYPMPRKVYGGYLEHVVNPTYGFPKNFVTVRNDFIVFYPYPDKSYTFNLHYFARDIVLATPGSENKWSTLAEDLMVAEAGWHVSRNIRDAQRASEFGQDRAEARRRIAQETTSKIESQRRAIYGSGEDAMLGQSLWESGHQ
jgi:hypothetical protein